MRSKEMMESFGLEVSDIRKHFMPLFVYRDFKFIVYSFLILFCVQLIFS